MRNFTLIALLIPVGLIAQKVKVAQDTIYKDNIPYALLIEQGDALDPIYSIRALNNNEVALVKYDDDVSSKGNDDEEGEDYYRVTFLGSGAVSHFPYNLNMEKRLGEAIVQNDLVNDSAINPAGEKRWLILYPQQKEKQQSVIINVNTAYNGGGTDYTTAERNRNMMIIEAGGQLTQAGVKIGTCATTVSYMGGKGTATVKYYLPNGVKCAEATCDNIGAKSATVVTMKDNRTHTITISNSARKEQEIAKYLADNYYL